MTAPELTVLITAWNRRGYLREALESVQIERPSSTEVLVLANFPDPELEGLLRSREDRWLLSREVRWGAMVAEGLEAAEGNVVACLDDDDLCLPGRLSTIVDEFQAEPDLGFYHNGQAPFVDGSLPSRPPGDPRARWTSRGASRSEQDLRTAWYMGAGYNASSLAVRRRWALTELAGLRRIYRGVPAYLFYRAWVDGQGVCMDPHIRTAVRLHGSNISPNLRLGPRARFARLARIAPELASDGREILRGLPPGTWGVPLEQMVALDDVLGPVGEGRAARRAGASAVLSLLRRRNIWLPRWNLIVVAAARAVSPVAASRLVTRWAGQPAG